MKPSIVFALILIVGFIGLGIYHEQTHVEIFRSYGIESHVDYISYFPSIATVPESPCPSDMCILAHNNADSIMYPLGIFYIVFGILLFQMFSSLETLIKIHLHNLRR